VPCILLWGTHHFVVLRKVTQRGWHLHDPAVGRRFYRNADVAARFSGVALELTPGADRWQPVVAARVRLRELWAQASGTIPALTTIIALSIALQLVALVTPLYVQLVVDDALLRNETDLLTVLAIAFAGLAVIGALVGHLRSVITLRFGATLDEQLSANLCAHLLRLPYLFFVQRDIGDINARFGDLTPVLKVFTAGIAAVFIDGLLAISTFALLFNYQPMLTFTAAGFLLAALLLQLATLPRRHVLTHDSIRRAASAQTLFIESLRSIVSLKANGIEHARADLWRRQHGESVDAATRLGLFGLRIDSARTLLNGLDNVVIVYLGAMAVIESPFTVGMLYAFIAYKSHFARATTALVEQVVEFRMLRLHLERLADIALEPAAVPHEDDTLIQARLRGQIHARGLSFRYGPRLPAVLDGVDLTVAAGTDVAILGRSGSGKSTLLKILLGLIEPDAGTVVFDHGRNLNQCRAARRSSVGVVLQDDRLFTGSILDNVALFSLEPDLARVAECCRSAVIATEIEALPMAYDTPLGDMGAALSAGQVQRLLLARALYKAPSILILDEATANLDDATRTQVNANLRQLGLTIIRVTHRADELAQCDRVYRLDNGTLRQLDRTAS
jgi:ATP-binding cassette subfamily B protein RaxB